MRLFKVLSVWVVAIIFAAVLYSGVIYAGQLQAISSSELAWLENGQQLATVSRTSINNWKVKRSDGFYIGLITKRGDVKPRDSGLKVNDMRMLLNIHEALTPYISR